MSEPDHDRLIRHEGEIRRIREDLNDLREDYERDRRLDARQREKDMKVVSTVKRFQTSFIAASGGFGIVIGVFADYLKHKFGIGG